MQPKLSNHISRALALPERGVSAVLTLLSDGATIPFIARYRKEASGNLDEVQLAAIDREKKRLDDLIKRREYILATIDEQGKLTDKLRREIEDCWDETRLEDLYLPYKRKRKTRAEAARQRGLEPLADWLWKQERGDVAAQARRFLNDEVADTEAALAGARDIIAERINEDEAARNRVRKHFRRSATISAKPARGKKEEADKYRDYFDFSEPLSKAPSHRVLALLRGESEGLLSLTVRPDEEATLHELERHYLYNDGPAAREVRAALRDGYQRLLAPSIETEFRKEAKERADRDAIDVFVNNLRQLLLAPPLGKKRVLGIDPGFRTGCKVVAIDANGTLLGNTTIYPHPPQNKTLEAAETLRAFAQRHQLEVAAIGNGTAGRETLDFCRGVDFGRKLDLFLVDESGASIYSASDVAREEFPDQDVTVRGSVSIARRLLDPLAELVKLDPKNIGVGQYQHDVNQTLLKEELDRTVESCVNSVGINLNTASKHLLTYVSGLGPALAGNIVTYRSEHGPFRARRELKKVARLGEKSYEQAAGFLRIPGAKNPLDNTAVHPERYALVERMAGDLGVRVEDLIQRAELRKKIDLRRYVREGEVGLPTLKDILAELAKPGLDPRGEAQTFEFGKVRTIEDLREGMTLPGIVTNVTNFGAFVDIGIKENGLVHISQLADRYVSNPADVVSLRQQVRVRVLSVDRERKRIQLSMKGE